MKWIAPSLVALLVLGGCGTAVSPATPRAHAPALQAASTGGLLSRMQEPFPGVVEANYKEIDAALADRLLAHHPRALTELAGKKVKLDGELDWDRRWYRTGPRAIYLTRGGERYEVDKLHSWGLWEKAIGKKVTVYIHVVEHEVPKERIVPFLAGVRYFD